jgi:glycosyltransferase involved in cell wall biosynthesis
VHIVQVLLSPRIGGAETLAAGLAIEWATRGVSSEVVYLDDDDKKNPRHVRVRRLRKSLRSMRPDVVVAHSALPNLYARLAAPRHIPIVVVLHSAGDDFDSLVMRSVERLLRARTRAVVGVSQAQLDQYTNRFGFKVPTSVIANGVRPDLPFKERHATTPRSVVTVARVALQKNPMLWIQTANDPAMRAAGLAFDWWGPVAPASEFEALVSEHAETGREGRFMGPTDNPGDILISADIYFHPSSMEAHSIGLLEAASVGLPIVCSFEVAQTVPAGTASAIFGGPDDVSATAAILNVINGWDQHTADRAEIAASTREQYGMRACSDEYLYLFSQVV